MQELCVTRERTGVWNFNLSVKTICPNVQCPPSLINHLCDANDLFYHLFLSPYFILNWNGLHYFIFEGRIDKFRFFALLWHHTRCMCCFRRSSIDHLNHNGIVHVHVWVWSTARWSTSQTHVLMHRSAQINTVYLEIVRFIHILCYVSIDKKYTFYIYSIQ